MNEPEILTDSLTTKTLKQAKNQQAIITLSYRLKEKWKLAKANFFQVHDDRLEIIIQQECLNCAEILKIDQPVGISFKMEHWKYVFETKVISCSCQNRAVNLELPQKIEKRPRRAYVRVAVPANMQVNVIFWHRGYDDDKEYIPHENIWQGKLENLSAGGMKILIDSEKQDFFSPGQLLGLQFTPMPYEKPILLEGLVRHLEQQDHQSEIGIEFLGLESGWQGSDKTNRLTEVINKYESIQQSNNTQQQHED